MALGWGSDLMQSESTFLVFDATMILVSILLITVFHPWKFFTPLGAVRRGEVVESDHAIPLDSRHNSIERGSTEAPR